MALERMSSLPQKAISGASGVATDREGSWDVPDGAELYINAFLSSGQPVSQVTNKKTYKVMSLYVNF